MYVFYATFMALAWVGAALRTGDGWTQVFRNLGVLLLLFGLMNLRLTGPRTLRAAILLRFGLACVVLPFNYLQTGPLISKLRLEAVAPIESFLMRTDEVLLGPGFHDWLLGMRHPLVTEILQLCYASFFFLPMILMLVLFLRGKRHHIPTLLFVVPVTFLLSYTIYLIVPARSPGFLDDALAPQEGLFFAQQLWQQIREAAAGVYDAFPSGHTAVTLLVVLYAWKFDRVAFSILLPVGLGLILSTVYLQYHYLVDVPSGAVLTFFVILWDRALRRRAAAAGAEAP